MVRPCFPALEPMDEDHTDIPKTEDFGGHQPLAHVAPETSSWLHTHFDCSFADFVTSLPSTRPGQV